MKIRFYKTICFLIFIISGMSIMASEKFISENNQGFVWIRQGNALPILVDSSEYKGVLRAIQNLQKDAIAVTDEKPEIINQLTKKQILIIGSIEKSSFIRKLIKDGKIDKKELEGKWEKYIIKTIKQPFENVEEAVVIAGSDKRGTIYGIYELSAQMGVSPWYYWADVPVMKKKVICIKPGEYTDNEPAVKYRGIFLNDEAPALSGWAKATFDGFNSNFYEKVFELILRLKGNFMWPAMWGNAFYDDDPKNGPLADEMGIVMGTSHHEPMGLAQQDWKRQGSGAWDYSKNSKVLRSFWKKGIERCHNWESIITVGMRGDGDEPMSDNSNIKLLQKIVKDQRSIIEEVTGKKAAETPQSWALYKEVQDYYDKGMRVPDDITLMLCDDNWGNVRKLPELTAKPRKGGYGMYYHFDYVGAPRNSKWLNVTQIQRTWEQMNLAYNYGVRNIWIVNVGDLKPMEYPITFFLDLAWDPLKYNENNLFKHTENFCRQQFGQKYAKEAAELIDAYTKYNRRVTPEMLNDKTYSLKNYNEWQQVKEEYSVLCEKALKLYYLMPKEQKDCFDQLVLFPIQSCSNLYDMYYALAKNKEAAESKNKEANFWAQQVKNCFKRDSVLTYYYNHIMSNGKWNHMMDQTHIGYRSWFDPKVNIMPKVQVISPDTTKEHPVFIEKDGYISIEAEHFTRSHESDAKWIIIPNLGRTLSSITTSPCTVTPGKDMYLEYDFKTERSGDIPVFIRFSPTLNFNANKGLSYAVSMDNGPEQIININGKYKGELGKWQAEYIITTKVVLHCDQRKEHTLRIRPLNPALVIQKIMIDFGGLKPSFLGPPESMKI